LLFAKQPLDDAEPGTHGVYVPGSDLDGLGHVASLSPFCISRKGKAPAPGAWSEGRPSVRHARDPAGRG
jgi:hypothetical protein